MPLPPMPDVTHLMQHALLEAQAAAAAQEVPVGAVLADATGHIIARAHNRVRRDASPLAHAELLCVQAALPTHGPYLSHCTLVVTLEPCAMCAGTLAATRVGRVVYGAADPKSGGTDHGARVFQHSHWQPEVLGGIEEAACSALLSSFFATKRTEA